MSKEHITVADSALGDCDMAYTAIESIGGIVDEMREGFASGTMRDLSVRRQQLRALLKGLRSEEKRLIDSVYCDLHRSKEEATLCELQAVEYEIGLFLENLDKWARPEGNSLSSEQPAFTMSQSQVRREPLGTVLIMGAWNYPIRLTLLPLVGAIAAGNTVVVKPSEISMHSALAIEHVIAEYMDPRIIRVVQGGADESTELLRQKFDHFFYTGNGTVGRIVARAAAEHLAGVTLELGGKSPAIVHADVADLVPTAFRIVWAKMVNAGQTCVGVDYVLVHRSVKDKLVLLLVDAVRGMYGGSPQKSADYGRIINGRHWKRLMSVLDASEGTLVAVADDEADEADRYFPPTIVDGVRGDDSLMRDELFGPILPIVTYDTLEEAIAFVNARDQPLALYAFAAKDSAEHVVAHTRSGSACVNDTMFFMASHATPFGGVGPSGVGCYTGRASFETFSHRRHVMKRPLWFPTPGLDSMRAPPFAGSENAWKAKLTLAMTYPNIRPLRQTMLGKLATFIPFWRVLVTVPRFLWALVSAQPTMRRHK
ncbi:hypothetical protein IW140_002960 [Coemansia sp. RSA 1813]|nr:hypothetical protein EV178_003835 [Coemansia sp. RSA 1646]KAJ1770612.1 hypothetical protein LPJ74_003061 [Coemansia sp. RSA 1843]KAJ2091390.1 hypothetical protein IW138_001849 [Coemansia sp. RSA 986]KAJ2212853.1 hypothetical protein EV179_004340 [Coemansia sp. RSA 487]KAJ2569552.1 hypothetical protein IW140_002960 [Coemansia sp. RSA 1813]